jgi:hypothetical protein
MSDCQDMDEERRGRGLDAAVDDSTLGLDQRQTTRKTLQDWIEKKNRLRRGTTMSDRRSRIRRGRQAENLTTIADSCRGNVDSMKNTVGEDGWQGFGAEFRLLVYGTKKGAKIDLTTKKVRT